MPLITTATVILTCPECGTTGKGLARYDTREPGAAHHLCYRCGWTWDVVGERG